MPSLTTSKVALIGTDGGRERITADQLGQFHCGTAVYAVTVTRGPYNFPFKGCYKSDLRTTAVSPYTLLEHDLVTCGDVSESTGPGRMPFTRTGIGDTTQLG